MLELDRFEEVWGGKYPLIVRSWRNNWEELATFFKYPPLYLATTDVIRKWTGRVQNWGQMLLQLSVFYPDRIGQHLR